MGALNTALTLGETFGKYGKLIGTGKNNGIRVFEQLFEGERVLTSVGKNNEVLKTVKQSRVAAIDIADRPAANYMHSAGVYRARLTEVEKANGDKMMNLRGVNNGNTVYQRLTRDFANGEREALSWKMPELKPQNGRAQNGLRPFRKGILEATLDYTNLKPIEGGYDFVHFNIGAKNESAVSLEAYRAINEPAKLALDAKGNVQYREIPIKSDYPKGTFLSRQPIYESAEKYALPVNDEVYIDRDLYGRFLYGSKRGQIDCENGNIDKHTFSAILKNMYEYVEKIRGCNTKIS